MDVIKALRTLAAVLLVVLTLLVLMQLGGCTGKVAQISQTTTVQVIEPVDVNPLVEKVLDAGFRANKTIPWKEGRPEKIAAARSAIDQTIEYQEAKYAFDNKLPYYDVKSSLGFLQHQYNILETELNARRDEPGAITEEIQVIYWYTVKDIHTQMKALETLVAATEKGIDDRASADVVAQMKNVYSTIKPLITVVKALK